MAAPPIWPTPRPPPAPTTSRRRTATTSHIPITPAATRSRSRATITGPTPRPPAASTVGGSTTGAIETNGDADWFAVSLTAGYAYDFSLRGTTLSDPALRLYDCAGTLISSDIYNWGGTANLSYTTSPDGDLLRLRRAQLLVHLYQLHRNLHAIGRRRRLRRRLRRDRPDHRPRRGRRLDDRRDRAQWRRGLVRGHPRRRRALRHQRHRHHAERSVGAALQFQRHRTGLRPLQLGWHRQSGLHRDHRRHLLHRGRA